MRPCHRTIMAVDIEASATRTDPGKALLRDAMYELVEKALDSGGVVDHHRDPFVDRGDGLFTLIRPVDEIPKTLLLNPVVPVLRDLLQGRGFRLRVVIHAGEVHYDARGCFGEALDIAFRLLDSPELKRKLKNTTEPMILVVSEEVYFSVVRHRYEGIDDHEFEPSVRVRVAGRSHRGWVHLPAERSAAPVPRSAADEQRDTGPRLVRGAHIRAPVGDRDGI